MVSKPNSLVKSGALIPAAQTIKSASIFSPSLVIKAPSTASVIIVFKRTSTPALRNSESAELDTFSVNAGIKRGPASTKVTFKLARSNLPKPYSFKCATALYNSAESSIPVAPPPTIAIFTSLSWLCENFKNNSNMRCWNCFACSEPSKKIQCSATPLVPKSFDLLPIAMINLS